MGKITDYPKVTTLKSDNVFLLDGPDGTKLITTERMLAYFSSESGLSGALVDISNILKPENHRNIFRGKNLGTVVTDAQKKAIQDGTFDDLFIGDYWTINGTVYRIADMDYFLRCGDTDFTKHHLVLVPDTNMYSAKMNEENVTTGGYTGSKMYTENLEQAKTKIATDFGSLVLTHREYLTNAVSNGAPSGGAWFDSTVELMNEIMVYGTHVYAAMGTGSSVPNKYTVGKTQMALFRLMPKFISNRQWFWLRDVVSAASFACVGSYGYADYSSATGSGGVRPEFIIG